MRWKGINYDTGLDRAGALPSRATFDPERVRREIEVIARDLHCTAIRISGSDPRRIALAAEYALEEGLEAWFAPFPSDMSAKELVQYFGEGAALAENLHRRSSRVVFVMGCEMTLFNRGFVPGATYIERIQGMVNPALLAGLTESVEEMERRFNAFLASAVASVRQQFRGQVTYASGPWEAVDWHPFDIVGVDHYRDASNRDVYREQLRDYFVHQRPVAVTEFGCCTYRGADERGAMGWTIVDRAARPPRLTEQVDRDEQTQAEYLAELLDILEEQRVDGAFWYTFASFNYLYSSDPPYDLDRASFGVVRALNGEVGTAYPGMPWEPKRSFYALAERYAHMD